MNALYFPEPNFTLPPSEGCRIALRLGSSSASDHDSQYVNVSIHSGGGECVDPPAESLGTVTWQQNVTSGTGGTSTTASIAIELVKAPGICFEQSPLVSVSSSDNWGFFRPPPGVCEASYPPTLDAGAITVSGPGFGPISMQPANQNGTAGYQATLPIALQAGSYSVSAQGAAGVASFSAEATLPPPISITNDLRPGTAITLPFTLHWTGGGSDSVVGCSCWPMFRVNNQRRSSSPPHRQAKEAVRYLRLRRRPPSRFQPAPQSRLWQQPAKAPSRPFGASGLTLGGDQTWRYVFDFTGIESR